MTDMYYSVSELRVYFLNLLCLRAKESPDPSSQNAAVIGSTRTIYPVTMSTNHMPEGCEDLPDVWGRPQKYERVVHAETGAISLAARYGIGTEGASMYACWASCGPCASLIVNAGIKTVVTLESSKPSEGGGGLHDKWNESIIIGCETLAKAGVEVIYVPHPVTAVEFTLLRNGKDFRP